MYGAQEYREKVVSELPAHKRRNLALLPVDVILGTSYQIAFKLNPALEPPFFVARNDAGGSRQQERGFNQLKVGGPCDHMRSLLDFRDWRSCLSTYRFFADLRIQNRRSQSERNTITTAPSMVDQAFRSPRWMTGIRCRARSGTRAPPFLLLSQI